MKSHLLKSIANADGRTKERRCRPAPCSAFRAWFEAQHGKRPNTGNMTDDKLRKMMLLGEGAGREMYSRKIYDAKWQSALYAWTAKDVSEKEIMRRLPNDPS